MYKRQAYNIESRLLEISDLTLLTITHNMSKDILELYDEIIFMADGKIINANPKHWPILRKQ